jgi:hypothetical protein
MQAQKLDEEKTPSKQFHLRNMTSMDKKKEVATSNVWSICLVLPNGVSVLSQIPGKFNISFVTINSY